MRSEHGGVKAWLLAFVLVAGGGLGALIGIGCAIDANRCPFGGGRAVDSTDGRVLFAAYCARCHGLRGTGDTGPSLVSGPLSMFGAAELAPRIADGKPLAGMPAFKRELSAEQIRAVADYVVSLRESSSTPEPSPEGSP